MTNTLRVSFPQWQGGNRPEYYLGAQLLDFLAPKTTQETLYIPVSQESTAETKKDGIVAKEQLLSQTKIALEKIGSKNPDKLVILGGDCSVDLAPFAYLLEKYGPEKTGILWIDSHMDIFTPETFENYHAMVVTSLLGEGDKDFANLVAQKLQPDNIVYAGINDPSEKNRELYDKYRFKTFDKKEVEDTPNLIVKALKERGIEHLMIHFDLDVLSLNEFRATYFAELPIYDKSRQHLPEATSLKGVVNLIQEADKAFNLVGLGITEHLPWDAIILQKMLAELPLISES
ncbi:arginase family protein [Streptococcus sp. zg-JUN1979]|uniref:arginase family protein n=1 Tax=Streptococcus sp. zg-JUN1979 TaxID=3391450 RepID=UPI0039A6EE7C